MFNVQFPATASIDEFLLLSNPSLAASRLLIKVPAPGPTNICAITSSSSAIILVTAISLARVAQSSVFLASILTSVDVPVIYGSVGTASDATIAMELGCDGVLDNTAIAKAKKPFDMALAFKNAVISGRQSYLAGRIKKTLMGNPSSPKKGII